MVWLHITVAILFGVSAVLGVSAPWSPQRYHIGVTFRVGGDGLSPDRYEMTVGSVMQSAIPNEAATPGVFTCCPPVVPGT